MSQEWGVTNQRRKSFGFFSRPTILQELSDSGTNSIPRALQKSASTELRTPRSRPKSLLFGTGGGFTQELSTTLTLPSPRNKVLTKAPRPRSVFGSFKSKEIGFVSESSGSSSAASSHERDSAEVTEVTAAVLHHGEALSTGGLLRRKREYLVLTTRELLRYKSQQKAWEQLGTSCINPKTPTTGRSASFSSTSDLTMSDNVVTSLHQIIAVYMPEMDVNSTTIQVDHVDELTGPGSTIFQLPTVEDAHAWLDNIRKAAAAARDFSDTPPISTNTIAHIARRLEAEKDYAPDQFFRVYTIVQRGPNGKHHRSSSDDLHKMYSTVCYLAIGVHKVHIVPIPKTPTNRSATSLLLTGPSMSYGTLTLTTLTMSTVDDSFTLGFR